MDLDSDNIITIHACFILHNFCEMYNEIVRDELIRAVQTYDAEFQPPCQPADAMVHNNERGEKSTSLYVKL